MNDKILNISIRIADLPRLPLRIPASEEALVRKVEASINELWRKWSKKDEFKAKSSAEILGMVTFRFAQLYYSNREAAASLDGRLSELETALANCLFEIPDGPDAGPSIS